jgi:hypothetical protein
VKKTATLLALLAIAIGAGTAAARNFHCAGGIQYVIQGVKEKDKGNLEDAHRIFGKAVSQLRECTTEDPNDSESWSYLGWALAEVDSAAEAGAAFDQAEKRLAADPKKLLIATQNRKSYWVNYYNDGLSKYKSADSIVKVATLLESTDPNAPAARAKLAASEALVPERDRDLAQGGRRVQQPRDRRGAPGQVRRGQRDHRQGSRDRSQERGPAQSQEDMVFNTIKPKLDAGDYAGALDVMDQVLASSPNDPDRLIQAAQTSFEYAQKLEEKKDAGAKAMFGRAAGYYGRAAAAATDAQNKGT